MKVLFLGMCHVLTVFMFTKSVSLHETSLFMRIDLQYLFNRPSLPIDQLENSLNM